MFSLLSTLWWDGRFASFDALSPGEEVDFLVNSGDFSGCFIRGCSGDRIGAAGAGTGAAATVRPAEDEGEEAGGTGTTEEPLSAGRGRLSGCLSAGRRTGGGARDSNCMLSSSLPSAKSLSAITLLCSVNHLQIQGQYLG